MSVKDFTNLVNVDVDEIQIEMPTCFLCFQIKNPKWKPTDQGAQFISTIKENGECETFKYYSMECRIQTLR